MLRNYIFRIAWQMDRQNPLEISDMVSICNFRANRLCCEAADRAMQVHGGMGYSRALPFEHIYRHHRRYRITEGSEEVQIRRVAQYLFGFSGKRARQAHERGRRSQRRSRFRRRPPRRLSEGLARRRRADARRAHARRDVEPDLFRHPRRLARRSAQAAEQRARAFRPRDRSRISRAERVARHSRADARTLSLLRRPRGARHAVLSDGVARGARVSGVLDARACAATSAPSSSAPCARRWRRSTSSTFARWASATSASPATISSASSAAGPDCGRQYRRGADDNPDLDLHSAVGSRSACRRARRWRCAMATFASPT